MNEILIMLNALSADELDSVIMRATIMLEKKKKEEAEQALLEKERQRQEKIAQEKKRQEEIAELQRKLKELQSQSAAAQAEVNQVRGDGFVMRDTAASQNQVSSAAAPAAQAAPAARPQAAPQPAPAPAAQPQAGAAQVRYADEAMKKWEMLPGEKSVCANHEIRILQPDMGRKYQYSMEITDKRILLTRISAVAASAGMAFGLIGTLVRDAAGAGAKPWLEIPLTAVSNCGLQDKKEFFIVADQTYVLKNKGYEKFLPELVAKAKM